MRLSGPRQCRFRMEDGHEGRPVRAENSMGFPRYAFLTADCYIGLRMLEVAELTMSTRETNAALMQNSKEPYSTDNGDWTTVSVPMPDLHIYSWSRRRTSMEGCGHLRGPRLVTSWQGDPTGGATEAQHRQRPSHRRQGRFRHQSLPYCIWPNGL